MLVFANLVANLTPCSSDLTIVNSDNGMTTYMRAWKQYVRFTNLPLWVFVNIRIRFCLVTRICVVHSFEVQVFPFNRHRQIRPSGTGWKPKNECIGCPYNLYQRRTFSAAVHSGVVIVSANVLYDEYHTFFTNKKCIGRQRQTFCCCYL